MARYIGLDVHSASCTMVVVNHLGKKLSTFVVETNTKALIDLIKTIPKPRYLCTEEGTQSAWLYENLSGHVDRMVVTTVAQSKGPWRPKDDERDAFELADKMRTNSLPGQVFKEVGQYGKLRELVRVHSFQVRDVVRVQNRIKALYRSRGIETDDSVYKSKKCQPFMDQLPPKHQAACALLLAQYEALVLVRKETEKQLRAEARKHPLVMKVCTIPGIAVIRGAQLVAVIVSPNRFRTKRQLWKYSGLGIVMRSSSDWAKDDEGNWVREATNRTRGLNRNHNSILKSIFKGAATTVITSANPDCPLYQHYLALIKGSTKPNLAKVTIARQIASITLTIMKKEVVYDPKAVHKTTT